MKDSGKIEIRIQQKVVKAMVDTDKKRMAFFTRSYCPAPKL